LNSLTKVLLFLLVLVVVGASTVATVSSARTAVEPDEGNPVVNEAAALTDTSLVTYTELGVMRTSWYGVEGDGKLTANGETFDMDAMTAAHKSFQFNTLLKVTNIQNDKSVIVRINDRGPYIRNRQLDLSFAAARELDILEKGVATVKVEKLNVKNIPFPVVPIN
jgi:rare lipoprotein A